MGTKKNGVLEISTMHGIWLFNMMNSKEYTSFIEDFHEKNPNSVFHHNNLSIQLKTMLAEQLENIAKEQKKNDNS